MFSCAWNAQGEIGGVGSSYFVPSTERSRPERTMRLDKYPCVFDAVRVTTVHVRTGESVPRIPPSSTASSRPTSTWHFVRGAELMKCCSVSFARSAVTPYDVMRLDNAINPSGDRGMRMPHVEHPQGIVGHDPIGDITPTRPTPPRPVGVPHFPLSLPEEVPSNSTPANNVHDVHDHGDRNFTSAADTDNLEPRFPETWKRVRVISARCLLLRLSLSNSVPVSNVSPGPPHNGGGTTELHRGEVDWPGTLGRIAVASARA